jgi:hypothetical protein
VLPAQQLEAEGFQVIGDEHVHVRVFDDTAFTPWHGPHSVHREMFVFYSDAARGAIMPATRAGRNIISFGGGTSRTRLSACDI